MPKPYPSEFRDDVVRVARNREPGVTIEQIAHDFGNHPMTLQKWLRRADIDEGVKPGQSRTEAAELREARKRIRLLEQENEVLRRAAAYLSQANLPGRGSTPLVKELAVDGVPVTVTCRVLKLARHRQVYQMASGVTHSEWWSIESDAMERCQNPLHRGHLIPSLSLNAGGHVELATAWVQQLHTLIRLSLRVLNTEEAAVQNAFAWLDHADDVDRAVDAVE